uniref:Uncharacterized protein n=1 Tax=Pseudictyota dubia TaxID=2749911 RepID=A0A7R9VVR6_9STRA
MEQSVFMSREHRSSPGGDMSLCPAPSPWFRAGRNDSPSSASVVEASADEAFLSDVAAFTAGVGPLPYTSQKQKSVHRSESDTAYHPEKPSYRLDLQLIGRGSYWRAERGYGGYEEDMTPVEVELSVAVARGGGVGVDD